MFLPIIFSAIIFSTDTKADNIKPFEILHIPRRTALEGEILTIEIEVTQSFLVRKGEMRWRKKNESNKFGYQAIPLVRERNSYKGSIPSLEIVREGSGQ